MNVDLYSNIKRLCKKITALAAALLAFNLLLGCSTSDFFLGKDNRPAPKELTQIDNKIATKILWQHKIGASGKDYGLRLQPTILNDNIYAVNERGALYAFSRDGALQYQIELGNNIAAGVSAFGDKIFVGTRSGDLLALNASDGSSAWREHLAAMMISPAAFSKDKVIVRTIDGTIHAFALSSGEKMWQYHGNEPILSVRGNASPVVGGGVVIITTDGGKFVVLDEKSGLPVMEERVVFGRGSDVVSRFVDMDATPQIVQNVLFGSSYQAMLFAVDLVGGKMLWKQEKISTQQDFALSPDGIFIVANNGDIASINPMNGDILWRNEDLQGRELSPPASLPNTLAVVDGFGYLHWLSARDGSLIGRSKISSAGANTRALLLNDRLIWQLLDGNIVALTPTN